MSNGLASLPGREPSSSRQRADASVPGAGAIRNRGYGQKKSRGRAAIVQSAVVRSAEPVH